MACIAPVANTHAHPTLQSGLAGIFANSEEGFRKTRPPMRKPSSASKLAMIILYAHESEGFLKARVRHPPVRFLALRQLRCEAPGSHSLKEKKTRRPRRRRPRRQRKPH